MRYTPIPMIVITIHVLNIATINLSRTCILIITLTLPFLSYYF